MLIEYLSCLLLVIIREHSRVEVHDIPAEIIKKRQLYVLIPFQLRVCQDVLEVFDKNIKLGISHEHRRVELFEHVLDRHHVAHGKMVEPLQPDVDLLERPLHIGGDTDLVLLILVLIVLLQKVKSFGFCFFELFALDDCDRARI